MTQYRDPFKGGTYAFKKNKIGWYAVLQTARVSPCPHPDCACVLLRLNDQTWHVPVDPCGQHPDCKIARLPDMGTCHLSEPTTTP